MDHRVLFQEALRLSRIGNLEGALQKIEEALREENNLDYRNTRAVFLHKLGRAKEAITELKSLVPISPHPHVVLCNLGVMQLESGTPKDAFDSFKKAAEMKPDYAEAYDGLGSVYRLKGDSELAQKLYSKAVSLQPKFTGALNNLGLLAMQEFKFENAITYFRQVLEYDPYHEASFFNLALSYYEIGDVETSLEWCKKLLDVNKNNQGAHVHLAQCLFQKGLLEDGWKEYEWRIPFQGNIVRKLAKPVAKSENLHNNTIYVYHEQGFGDTILFLRYVYLLAKKAQKILLRVQPELFSFVKLQKLPAKIELIPPEVKDEELSYDYHLPLLSLPFVLKENQLPQIKLTASKELTQTNHKYFTTDKLNVGIFWHGSATHARDGLRSVNLKELRILFDVRNVAWFSLQKGRGEEELEKNSPITPLGNLFQNFNDTAAVIANLDLVISVDSAVAHLAASLGKKTWLLTQFVPDWRWGMHGKTTNWYQDMHLFRQTRIQDWTSVITQVRSELEKISRTYKNHP